MRPVILYLALCGLLPATHAATLYTVVDLGPYGAAAGGYSLTAAGTVAGWHENSSGTSEAFVAGGGTWKPLTPLQAGYDTQAFGINNSGDAAGVAYRADGGQAVVWRQGVPKALGAGAATAINGTGQVTGGITTANGQTHGFVTNGTGVQDIGTLKGGTWSSGFAINGAGQVAGYGDASGAFHAAFRYVNGQLQELGSLDGGNSYAYGINSYGAIVGYGSNGASGLTAFLFRGGRMLDLNTLLVNASPYYLTAAYAINDRGQITGTGLLNGVERAIRLDPVQIVNSADVIDTPEPSTAALLMLAAALFGRWKWRRTRQFQRVLR